ncbi:MAG: Crp/Fnr family transcriptional regulator [Flavobacteriales bacterium]
MEIANPELVSRLEESFPQFDVQLRERIASIGTLMEFRPEQEVMRTGQYFKTTMLVLEGKVKLYREDEEGNEFFLYYLEPGMACALSMICAMRNQVSEVKAIAVEETLAIGLPIQHMDELMTEHRNWYYFVLETYRSRFEELLSVIDQVTFRSMDEKLIFYLKRQFEAFGTDTLHTTHQTIAYDLNSSREVISRLLKKLEQQGYVILHRNSIEKRKVDNSQFAW